MATIQELLETAMPRLVGARCEFGPIDIQGADDGVTCLLVRTGADTGDIVFDGTPTKGGPFTPIPRLSLTSLISWLVAIERIDSAASVKARRALIDLLQQTLEG